MRNNASTGQATLDAIETKGLRQKIHSELPEELFRPCPDRAFIALAIVIAIVALSAWLVSAPQLGLWGLVPSIGCGSLYASLFFLGHEAGHGSIVRSKIGQNLIMTAAFLIFILSPTLWRVWHTKVHHSFANVDGLDPDHVGSLTRLPRFKSIRIIDQITPRVGSWSASIYLPIWFVAHAQLVLWTHSRWCAGFESLNRPRAFLETTLMGLFWLFIACQLGIWLSLLVIVVPMLLANTIVMSYICTNHLLAPLVDKPDILNTTASLTTTRWLDLMHFNFSHHVEHHFFPSMSSRHAPCVRKLLSRYAATRFVVLPHWVAIRMLFSGARIFDEKE